MRLYRQDIDRILGGTPCLCGDTETWHRECYAGKSADQIEAEYKKVYRRARVAAKMKISRVVDDVIDRAMS